MLKWWLLVEDGRKAATAAHYGLTVVTRDTTELKRARTCFQSVAGH
jgi:predicted nucleic acid-binding protein